MAGFAPFLMLLATMVLLPAVVLVLAWRTGHGWGWLVLIAVLGLCVWSGPALWSGHAIIGQATAYRALHGVMELSAVAFLTTALVGLVLVGKRWNGVLRW